MDAEGMAHMLLIEDNPGDILLTQQALKHAGARIRLSVALDGEEAVRFLKKQGEFAASDMPDMILLDLNLPRLDGREVLTEIKKDEALRHIPVVVLTSSEADSDILQTYGLHTNCYVAKPAEFDKFVETVQTITSFWLGFAKLPSVKYMK